MHKQFLVLFLKVLFLSEDTSHHAVLPTLKDSLYKLGDADNKYQEAIHKYNNLKTQKDLNNDDLLIVIPIEKHKFLKKQILRINQHKMDEEKAIIVQREHEARMKDITDFMEDHMMTTKYLYEEVQRIKKTRQVKDNLREMVTYLEKPERYFIKNMFLNIYAFARKHHREEEPNVWDQKVNDMVINVMKDPFNDGVIN